MLCIAFAVLRVAYILHYRIDSDEPQHLHVVWGWTHGFLPYRDVFDNHAPVFQALCAPLFRLLGERAGIVLWMRLAMTPFFVATLWCVKCIVSAYAGRRVGYLSAWLTALFPPFFFNSIEFRPDQMWSTLWMAVIALLVCGRMSPKRAFGTGLILGLAFAVSMKTVLMLATLGAALGGTLLITRDAEWRGKKEGSLALWTLAGLGGMLVIPLLVILYFVGVGAGHAMYYCVIQHNIIPGDADWHSVLRALSRLARWSPVVVIAGLAIRRRKMPVILKRRIGFVFLVGAFYYVLLVSFWPILTAEDYLPFYPAMAVTIAPLLLWLCRMVAPAVGVTRWPVVSILMLAELAWLIGSNSPFKDQTEDKIGMVADTLRMTAPTDYVMDAKGETIYRRRPFLPVLERMTLWRLHNGLMEDNIVQRMIETRTPLATARRMPAKVKQFIETNYVPIAYRLRVLGQALPLSSSRTPQSIGFEVTIPARYALVTREGSADGVLDGVTLDGPRALEVGHHEFVRGSATHGPVTLIWANAWERGYSPFCEIKADTSTQQD